MTPWAVEATKTAEADLGEAVLYIRDVLQNPQAASRLIDEFEACVARLATQPGFRPLARDERLARLGYRWVSVGGYMAFYTTNEETRTVYVERVLFGRSDWRAVL
jgi:plasmid stabilization system protein ParE